MRKHALTHRHTPSRATALLYFYFTAVCAVLIEEA